jgi:hypothetical protein
MHEAYGERPTRTGPDVAEQMTAALGGVGDCNSAALGIDQLSIEVLPVVLPGAPPATVAGDRHHRSYERHIPAACGNVRLRVDYNSRLNPTLRRTIAFDSVGVSERATPTAPKR